MKLIEGSRYKFKVEKKIDFDGRDFWVLNGPDKKKYLLDYLDYSSYNIELNKVLDCRVDKINCKGEVFLEPSHPYYSEGKEYDFNVTAFDHRIEKSGNPVKVVILIDGHNNEVVVPVAHFGKTIPTLESSVEVRIGQIVKGSIIVHGSSQTLSAQKSEEDNTLYQFEIKGESKGLDGKIYMVVEDRENVQYTIPGEYYTHYKLSVGDKFAGRFIRYKEGQGISVEPESPFFKPGNIYEFTVVDFIAVSDGIEDVMIIRDSYGQDHHVRPDTGAKAGDKLNYRVIKMRKGWPLLEQV